MDMVVGGPGAPLTIFAESRDFGLLLFGSGDGWRQVAGMALDALDKSPSHREHQPVGPSALAIGKAEDTV